jgi:hypothetical protein
VLEDCGQDTTASRSRQFLLLDPLPLPLHSLQRRCVGMVDPASWVGANLDQAGKWQCLNVPVALTQTKVSSDTIVQ